MTTKKQLLAMICDLSFKLDEVHRRIEQLEDEIYKPKPIKKGENIDGVKRKPGRPRKVK